MLNKNNISHLLWNVLENKLWQMHKKIQDKMCGDSNEQNKILLSLLVVLNTTRNHYL